MNHYMQISVNYWVKCVTAYVVVNSTKESLLPSNKKNLLPYAVEVVCAGGERGVHAARRPERGFCRAAPREGAPVRREGEETGLLPGLRAHMVGQAVPRGGQARGQALRRSGVHRQNLDHVRLGLLH